MSEGTIKNTIFASMDEAAKQAMIDFNQLPDDVKKQAATWLRKWCGKAGYKRLGRILVAYPVENEGIKKSKSRPQRAFSKEFNIAKHGMLSCYLKEIDKFPILSKEEEFSLAERARTDYDADAKEKLISSNLRFVVYVAKKYQNHGLSLLELIDAGNEGLIHAVDKFDERKGYRFNTYSIWWIKRVIYEAINTGRTVIRPSYLAKRIRIFNLRFVQRRGRKPTVPELAKALKANERAISAALQQLRQPISLDEIYKDLSKDVIEDPEKLKSGPRQHGVEYDDNLLVPSVDALFKEKTKKQKFREALTKLEPREQEILKRHFGLDEYEAQSLENISRVMHVSRERVRQIKENALRKLKIVLIRNKR
jgi:RNA polymerase primary sigma factor